MSTIGPGSPGWDAAVRKAAEMLGRGKITVDEWKKFIEDTSKGLAKEATEGGARPNQAKRMQDIANMQKDLRTMLNQLGVNTSSMPTPMQLMQQAGQQGQALLPMATAFGASVQAVTKTPGTSAFLGRVATRGATSGMIGTGTLATVGGALLTLAAFVAALHLAHEKIKADSKYYSELRDQAAIAWMKANIDIFGGMEDNPFPQGTFPPISRPRVAR